MTIPAELLQTLRSAEARVVILTDLLPNVSFPEMSAAERAVEEAKVAIADAALAELDQPAPPAPAVVALGVFSGCPSQVAGGRQDRCGVFAFPPRCSETVCGQIRSGR